MNRSPAPILPDRVLSAAAVDKLTTNLYLRIRRFAASFRVGSFPRVRKPLWRWARVALGASSARDAGAPDWDSH